jgi:hypothetical protein
MTRRVTPLLALLAFTAGCPSALGPTPEAFSECHTEDGHDFTIASADSAGDPLWIDGDTLQVSVGYGGGCEEHTFQICWPDGAFAESAPVQATLEIWHGGPVDNCEAWVAETLSFDLTPLKQAWKDAYGDGAGEIVVHVEGAPESVTYSFE